MYISKLALDHFRSWQSCLVDLTPGVTILFGANGLGKTNLVEAVEVLSTGASHRASSTKPLIARGESKAVVRANVEADGRTTTYEVTLAARGANRGRINSGTSLTMRDIVGRVPSVVFAPEDQRLVQGDPAARRTFLDQAGVLLIPGYAAQLQTVMHIARQRAALLKQLAGRGAAADAGSGAALSGLEVWTGQFIEAGIALTRSRAALVEQLAGPFCRIYAALADGDGGAGMTYVPSFAEVMQDNDPAAAIAAHFRRLYPGEVARGVNLIGPQRDDCAVTLDGVPAREYASNGEMWTLALALKLALHEVITRANGTAPIVILDDVFAQLDDTRRVQILDFACRQEQVLITVAAPGDVPGAAGDAQLIDVASLKEGMQHG